jgi:hypothetical protein
MTHEHLQADVEDSQSDPRHERLDYTAETTPGMQRHAWNQLASAQRIRMTARPRTSNFSSRDAG